MSRRQLPRGTAAQLDAATFLPGEIAVDTTNDELRYNGDGSVVGGIALARKDGTNISVTATGSTEGRSLADRFGETVNALDYGVSTSASGATNLTNLQAAIDAAAATYGVVQLPEGVVTCNAGLVLKTGVTLRGHGHSISTLKLANSQNDDLIVTNGAEALFGTGSLGGIHSAGLEGLRIDGNKANNSAGRGLVAYWYHCRMRSVHIVNCKEQGIFEEWGDFGAPDETYESMENHYDDVIVGLSDSASESWYHNGPHDSTFYSCRTVKGAAGSFAGLHVGPRGDGAMFVNCHLWGHIQEGYTSDWALVASAENVYWCNSTAEGGDVGQILVRGNDFICVGGHQYCIVQPNTQKGVEIGQSNSVSSITRSGTTATVTTSAAHNLRTGMSNVVIAGANESDYNGTYTVTVTGPTTFTYTVANSPTTPATGTITAKVTPAGYRINTKLTGFTSGALNFTSPGGLGHIDVTGFSADAAATLINGTPAATDYVRLYIPGISGTTSFHQEPLPQIFGNSITVGDDFTASDPGAALVIKETGHATSNRATMELGDGWEFRQDTALNGTRNFGIFDVDAGNYPWTADGGQNFTRDVVPQIDSTYSNGAAATRWSVGYFDDLELRPSASRTPSSNGDLSIQATDNNTLTFKYKGSDGTVRRSDLTLVESEISSAWLIVGSGATQQSHTGSTSETTLVTVSIPAGLMGSNGRVRVTVLGGATGASGNKTWRVKFGGTAFLEIVGTTTTLSSRIQCEIANRNATNSQVGGALAQGNWSTNTAAVITSAIDTTAAVNLTITGQLSSAGDSVSVESYLVEVFSN